MLITISRLITVEILDKKEEFVLALVDLEKAFNQVPWMVHGGL